MSPRPSSRDGPDRRSAAPPMRSAAARAALGAGAILSAVLIAYLPVMRAGFIWDDDRYVTENALLRSAGGLARCWTDVRATPQYYPMVFTSFWLEYRLWGLDPLGYHVINILLHGAAAVLLWRILRRLSVPGAGFAAAIFALHPVHAESVAWVTERKNVLSGVFYLSALWCYLRFSALGAIGATASRPWRWYAAALVLYGCALFSKTVTCTLPLAIFLLLWWKRGRLKGRDLLPLAPMLAVGMLLGLVTVWVETHHVGAKYVDWDLSVIDRCLIAGRAVWFYAAKLIWPAELIFFYPRWRIDAAQTWQYAFPLAAVVVIAALWLARRRAGRGPLVAAAYFIVTLGPALGFIDVYPMRFSFVADHFQYLASIGLVALFAALWTFLLRKVPRVGNTTPIAAGMRIAPACMVLLLLATRTWQQGHVYRDNETLYRDVLAKNPEAWLAHNNLGVLLKDRGELQAALSHYNAAIAVKPNYLLAHNNLAYALEQFGRNEEALRHYALAARLNPTNCEARFGLGLVSAKLGRVDEAVGHYNEVLRLDPDYPDAHNNLGNILAARGETRQALSHFRQALRARPDYMEAHINLAHALFADSRIDEAIEHYRQALRLKPDLPDVHHDLAAALLRQGKTDEAMRQFREALRDDPGFLEARLNLARVLESLGRREEAVEEYRETLRINPNHAEARARLDAALSKMNTR